MKRNNILLATIAIFSTTFLVAQEKEDVNTLDEVIVVGNRANNRTVVNSAVPVDVINVETLIQEAPQLTVNDILNYVIPSFNSVRQTSSDGTEHIDPITLRGMGPDQVLVLVNGKRRHTTSLVNYQNTVGNGSVGTDLGAIPISAIKTIEVLRDGAAALYGSDAIAGVVNIILKSFPGGDASITYGITSRNDGETYNFNGSYGAKLGKDGTIIFSAVVSERKKKNRTGNHDLDIYNNNPLEENQKLTEAGLTRKDFNFQIGDAQIRNQQFFVNAETKLADRLKLFSFGGASLRQGEGFGFRRLPIELPEESKQIFPNGFQPVLKSTIYDFSNSTGIHYQSNNNWNVDLSNTIGYNAFNYQVDNSVNYSLGANSPTSFDAGQHNFLQNTVNLDFSKIINSTINLAFGGEYRYEEYQIKAGDEASYKEGGSQSFVGFSPNNAVKGKRNSLAAYADFGLKLGNFSADVAGRFENYSDFGNTLNGKLALRYEYIKGFSVRGAISTGFRAPSLQQQYFSNSYTDIFEENGLKSLVTKGIFRNESALVRDVLGIDKLKEEKSINTSLGLTFRPTARLFITLDGYFIRVNDRIVLTSDIEHETLKTIGISSARAFTNAIDTETKGLDLVVSYYTYLGNGKLTANLSANANKTKIVNYHFPNTLNIPYNQYFGSDQVNIIESLSPKFKGTLNLSYAINQFNFFIRNTYFGKVLRTDPYGTTQEHKDKIVTDASIGYNFTKAINFTIGANNIFDIFPDKQVYENSYFGVFKYAPVQMGTTGANYFARLNFKF